MVGVSGQGALEHAAGASLLQPALVDVRDFRGVPAADVSTERGANCQSSGPCARGGTGGADLKSASSTPSGLLKLCGILEGIADARDLRGIPAADRSVCAREGKDVKGRCGRQC